MAYTAFQRGSLAAKNGLTMDLCNGKNRSFKIDFLKGWANQKFLEYLEASERIIELNKINK